MPNHPSTSAEFPTGMKFSDLFEKIDGNILTKIVEDMHPVILEADEILFRQNDPIDSAYLVTQGSLKVTISANGMETVVGRIGPGQPVGEFSLIRHEKRTATVTAVCRSELLKLNNFEALESYAPDVIEHMKTIVRKRIRRNRLMVILPELFGELNEKALNHIESLFEWRFLSRGETLFREGEDGESLYIVMSGKLQATTALPDGDFRVVGEIFSGEFVGEMAALSNEPRTATVTAVRDSEIVGLGKAAFHDLMSHYPKAMMYLIQLFIKRIRKTIIAGEEEKKEETVAVLPATEDIPLKQFCIALAEGMAEHCDVLHLNGDRLDGLMGMKGASQARKSAPHGIQVSSWLDEQERRHAFVLYETDMDVTHWTMRCLRRADKILVPAFSGKTRIRPEIDDALSQLKVVMEKGRRIPEIIYVILHPESAVIPVNTVDKLKELNARKKHAGHINLRWRLGEDMARLSRIITGRSVGIVLSGGGASGLAHIGVLKALKEFGITADRVGGTSIGAIIGAQYAMLLNHEKLYDNNKKAWVDSKGKLDMTIPFISLLHCKRFYKMSDYIFGDMDSEDLWLDFFCIAANLTTSETAVLDKGLLTKNVNSSASLPGVTPPMVFNGDLYVDGGVVNNLPVDVMRERGCGRIIAIDVTKASDFKVNTEKAPSPFRFLYERFTKSEIEPKFPGIVDLLYRTTLMGSYYKRKKCQILSDFFLNPPVFDVPMMDFSQMPRLVDTGYRYTRNALLDLEKKVGIKAFFYAKEISEAPCMALLSNADDIDA